MSRLRKAVIVVLSGTTAWDTFTSVYGVHQTLSGGRSFTVLVASVIFGVLITGVVLFTRDIIAWEQDFTGKLLRFFLVMAIAFDFYTAWLGNRDFLIHGSGGAQKLIILTGMTIFISGSPMLLSVLWDKLHRNY